MRMSFFIYSLAFVVALLNITACSDNLEEIANERDEISGDAVWHSPEIWSRAQSQRYFLRDHAVGYSYNAVSGDSYSLDDVRCQVVNRAELDRLTDVSKYFLYMITGSYHTYVANIEIIEATKIPTNPITLPNTIERIIFITEPAKIAYFVFLNNAVASRKLKTVFSVQDKYIMDNFTIKISFPKTYFSPNHTLIKSPSKQ